MCGFYMGLGIWIQVCEAMLCCLNYLPSPYISISNNYYITNRAVSFSFFFSASSNSLSLLMVCTSVFPLLITALLLHLYFTVHKYYAFVSDFKIYLYLLFSRNNLIALSYAFQLSC